MLFEYQQTTVMKDKVAIIKNEVLEEKLIKEITKIVNAIIMVYRFYIFEDYEDLKQHATQACYTNFMKFHPSKGTCFNYFSIISKRCLTNYTDRRKKHRNLQDISEQVDLEGRYEINYETLFDNLEDTLFGIIDENFIGTRRKKYVKITSLMIDYLRKTKKFISKSDLYSWMRSYGIKNTDVREFVKTMEAYSSEIFEVVK